MDEEIFPEEADGVITFMNTERLSRRKDTLGDIFHGLLIPGNEELKNKDMEKRRKEVFTEEEVRKTCNEEQKLVDKFTEENRVSDIKFMFSEGISPERIAEVTKLSLEKIKRFLIRIAYTEVQGFVRTPFSHILRIQIVNFIYKTVNITFWYPRISSIAFQMKNSLPSPWK